MNALSMPGLVGVAAVAPALVPVLWGDRWLPMVPLLVVVCLAGVPQCLTMSVGWIYQSQGRTGTMFKTGALTAGLGILAMVAAVHWGAIGVAPAFFVACRVSGLDGWRVLAENLTTALLSSVMGLVVWVTPTLLHLDRAAPDVLALQLVLGVTTYGGGTVLLQRRLVGEARALLQR